MNSSDIEIIRSAYVETLNHCVDTEIRNSDAWIQTITPSKKERWFNRVIYSKGMQTETKGILDKTLAKYQKTIQTVSGWYGLILNQKIWIEF